MARFTDLPVETIEHISAHLVLHSKTALANFCLTSQTVHQAGAPMLWQVVTLVFDSPDESFDLVAERASALAALAEAGKVNFALAHVQRLSVETPCLKYGDNVTRDRASRIDDMLVRFLCGLSAVQSFNLDLCMARFTLPSTIELVTSDRIKLSALNISGAYAGKLEMNRPMPDVQRLGIGYCGCRLELELAQFSALTHLRLALDNDGSDATGSSAVQFPPSLWMTLRELHLDLGLDLGLDWGNSSSPDWLDELKNSLAVRIFPL